MSWFFKKVPAVVIQDKGDPTDVECIGWISVRDRIPEYGMRVIVYDPHIGVVSGHRTSQDTKGDKWSLGIVEYAYGYSSCRSSESVTHWMPLPPAP